MNCVMRKLDFYLCENKDADQLRSNFFLNPEFQCSSLLRTVTAQPDLCQTWSETLKTSFLALRLIYTYMYLLRSQHFSYYIDMKFI